MKRIADFFACQLYGNGQYLIIIPTAAYVHFTQEFSWGTVMVFLATSFGLAFLYGVLGFFSNQPTPARKEAYHNLGSWKSFIILSVITLITTLAIKFLLAASFQMQLTEYSDFSLLVLILSIVFFTAENFIFETKQNMNV